MGKCRNCNLEILDDTDKCPLCRCVLEADETAGEAMYPNARVAVKRFRFVGNLILFLSILAESICIGISTWTASGYWWSLVTGLVLIYINTAVRLALIGSSGYRFKVVSLVISALIVLFGIDYLTGFNGWSLNYVLPSGILLLDVCILVIMAVNFRNWQSYMILQLLMILISVVPVVLLAVEIVDVPYPAVAAMAVSVFIFLGTLIIGDDRARTELKRRFHI
jgi:hypothetical protein